MSDRELILGRIRSALVRPPVYPSNGVRTSARGEEAVTVRGDDETADYARAGELDEAQRVALFAERCAEYRATVTRCSRDAPSVSRAVGEALSRHSARTVAVPPDLPPGWMRSDATFLPDAPPLTLESLDGCDGTLTGCELAIALTGTIVVSAGPGQGRRALSLIPDLHVCVVEAEQIVETVPEAIDRLTRPIGEGQPVTLISGPSATSDIELTRIEGVHGPRRLEVIIAADPA